MFLIYSLVIFTWLNDLFDSNLNFLDLLFLKTSIEGRIKWKCCTKASAILSLFYDSWSIVFMVVIHISSSRVFKFSLNGKIRLLRCFNIKSTEVCSIISLNPISARNTWGSYFSLNPITNTGNSFSMSISYIRVFQKTALPPLGPLGFSSVPFKSTLQGIFP